MSKFLYVIEKARNNFSAYVPDLPGCVATGSTKKEVERLILEAIQLHIAGLRADKAPIPKPLATASYAAVK